MLVKEFVLVSFDFNNFNKKFTALHKTQKVRLRDCATRFIQSNYVIDSSKKNLWSYIDTLDQIHPENETLTINNLPQSQWAC